MALTITHATTVAAADDGTSEIGVDEWHQAHATTGTLSSTQLDLAMAPTWTGAHTFSASVTGSTTVSAVKFTVTSTTTASAASIINSTSQTAAYTLKLPVDDGTSNQVLATDGSGVLSWMSVSTSTSGGSIAPLTITSTNVVEQVDSTVAQTFRVYNTYGSTANFERGVIDYNLEANEFRCGHHYGGTGSHRAAFFGTMTSTGTKWAGLHAESAGGRANILIGGSAGLVVDGSWVAIYSGPLYFTSSFDIAMSRNGAGVIEVNNGTPGTYRDIKVRNIFTSSLPTTNPGVAGQLWNNANVVNVSTG